MGCVLAALLVVGFALVIGFQVMGVLFSIAAPPQPPHPADVVQLEYTSTAYGVDEWVYATQQDACELVRYYEALDGICLPIGGRCGEGASSTSRSQNVAQCSGEQPFSIFAMRWNAVIATGYGGTTPTHFRLSREIYWTGEVPPTNFYNRQSTMVPTVP